MSTDASEVIPDFQKRKFASGLLEYYFRERSELIHADTWVTFIHIFNTMYELPIRNTPQFLNAGELANQREMLQEEFVELNEAIGNFRNRDKVSGTIEMIDAIGDIIYVAIGWLVRMGIDPGAVMREIQLSNMSKLGSDGKAIKSQEGKVLKGPNYFKPDFKRFVRVIKQEA